MGTETGERPRDRLTSWKEIARFLGRDERTVKRWEATRGLPVRRVPGSGRASVFAYAEELQAWLDGAGNAPTQPQAPPAKRAFSPLPALVIALLLVAGGLGLLWQRDARRDLLVEGGTHDPAAAALYRDGLHAWQTRSPSGLTRAVEDFNAAIRRDPHYALAYIGLANSYNLLPEFTLMAPALAYAKAGAAAARAVALAPNLPGAHAAMAFSQFYGHRDVAAAQREFDRAIALGPNDAIAHHWYATFLMTIGDFAGARREIGRAETIDPESAAILADKALILFYGGDRAAAATLLRQLEADQPLFASPHYYLSAIYLIGGNDRGYLAELKLMAETRHDAQSKMLAERAGAALRIGGHTAMLQALLDARLALYAEHKVSAYDVAQAYILTGDRANALRYLTISLTRQEPEFTGARINPLFANLHGTPQFNGLLRQSGLVGRS